MLGEKPYQDRPQYTLSPGWSCILGGALFVFAATMILDESSAGSNEQDYFILGGLALIGVYAFVRGLMRMRA